MSQQVLPTMHYSTVVLVKGELSRVQGQTATHRPLEEPAAWLGLPHHPLVATREPHSPDWWAQAPEGDSPATWPQSGSAPCTGNTATTIQSGLKEWVGISNIVHGYIVTDASANMLPVVKACVPQGHHLPGAHASPCGEG